MARRPLRPATSSSRSTRDRPKTPVRCEWPDRPSGDCSIGRVRLGTGVFRGRPLERREQAAMRALEAVETLCRSGQQFLPERLPAVRAEDVIDRCLGFVAHCRDGSKGAVILFRRLPRRLILLASAVTDGCHNPSPLEFDSENQGTGRRVAHPPPAGVTRRSGPDRPPAAKEERRGNERREGARRDEIPHGGTVLSRSNDSPGPGLTRVYKGV